jgi:hypothetical protein
MTEQRETEFVTGTVGGIIQKAADKWQVEITPTGSQYAKKCWTKSEDTRALAATLIGQEATFECGVSHWAKQDGTPVKSLWINAINPGAPPPQPLTQPAASAATPTQAFDPRQNSIERQCSLKAAVEFITDAHATTGQVITAAEVFLAWIQGRTVNEDEASFDEDIPF